MSKTKLIVFIWQRFFILFHFTCLCSLGCSGSHLSGIHLPHPLPSWTGQWSDAGIHSPASSSSAPLLPCPLMDSWSRCHPVWLLVLTFSLFLFGTELSLSEAPLTQWLCSNIPQAIQLAVWHSRILCGCSTHLSTPIQTVHITCQLAKCFIIFFNMLCVFSTSVLWLLVPEHYIWSPSYRVYQWSAHRFRSS